MTILYNLGKIHRNMFGESKLFMSKSKEHLYSEAYPSDELSDFVSLYFETKNLSSKPQRITICPDGYFKLIVQVLDGKISAYFLTGLWINEIDIIIPPKVTTYGIKFKLIAPEYILHREVESILNSVDQLKTELYGMNKVKFTTFPEVVHQFEQILTERLLPPEEILGNRLRLSQFLYSTYDDIQAKEVAEQIHWSHRQINRYLNRYVGVTLKKYLNIQKCYRSYLQIREGEFFPEKGFFDQAHFIREVKKHTGHTPTALFNGKNDQFIQLRNIGKL